MTQDTLEGFLVELPVRWHAELPDEPEQSPPPTAVAAKGPTSKKPIVAAFSAKWGVSTKPAWYKWYKLVGHDPQGTPGYSAYAQMAAARSLDELARILQDGNLTWPIDWVIDGIWEFSGKTYGVAAPPPKHPLWKPVDFRSVPGFLESFLATGSYGHSQVTVVADAILRDFRVDDFLVEEAWEAPAPQDAHYATATAGTFLRNLELSTDLMPGAAFGPATVRNVDTSCGCSPLPMVMYFRHDLAQTAVLGLFLFRHGLLLPDVLPLSYRPSSGSWVHQTHFRAEEEQWDVVVEWRCRPALGNASGTNDSWWLTVTCKRRLSDSNRVTRFVIPVPESSGCTGGTVSVQMYVDTATRQVTNENGIPLLNTLVEDGIRMLSDSLSGGRLSLWIMDRESALSEKGEFSLASYLPENVR